MKKFGTLVAMLSLAGLVGCAGGDDRNGGGGGIMLMDASTTPDATPPPPPTMDGSTTPPPSGSCGTLDVSTGLGPVPSSCLPRCGAATLETLNSCTDIGCQNSALMNDTTPSVTLTLSAMGMTDSLDLDCETCFNVMNNSCVNDSCPMQFNAFISCRGAMMGDCSAESAAIDTCIGENMAAFQSCQRSRILACFP